jgi:hypothetical protein
MIEKLKKNLFFSFLEPNFGMTEYQAQHYFKQVVAGVVEMDLKKRIS